MDIRYIAVLVVLIALVLICWQGEGFATMDEKANSIYAWFKENPGGSYSRYRDDMKRGSNIVEYEDMRKLIAKRPDFTLDDVKKVI